MLRVRLTVVSLALLLMVGLLAGQDNKSGADDTQPSTAKTKAPLPPHFKDLGLTEEQREKVRQIHANYKAKIDSLKEQIATLSKEERTELHKLLSDTQKVRLRELLSHESEPTAKDAPKEKPADPKTDSKKDDKKPEGK